MKQRITFEDLAGLSEDQKQQINDLWIPSVFDVAVASVCIDVEEEKYDNIAFVVGGIQLYNRTSMILHDIRYLEKESPEAPEETDSSEEAEDSELDESDIDFSYSRPTAFNKEDCIPLLTIGQMIEIIKKKGFGYGDFYFAAGINDIGCEIGRSYFDINNYGTDCENKELCDVLWEYVKAIL